MENKFRIGQLVQVKLGASMWHHYNWKIGNPNLYTFDKIDCRRGVIVADYTHLPGNDSHYGIDFGDGEMIGINPNWLC